MVAMVSQSLLHGQFKLGPVVRLGFGAMVFMILGVGISSKLSMVRVVDTSHWVKHTFQVIGDLRLLEKYLVDAETGQRGFLFTGNEQFLTPYNQALVNLEKHFVQLKVLTQDNPTQQRRLGQMHGLIDQKVAELKQTIALKQRRQEQQVRALVLSGKGQRLMDEIRVLLSEMQATEENLLQMRDREAEQATQLGYWIALGGTLVAIGTGTVLLLVIARQIIQPIHAVAASLADSASDMTSTVQDQQAIAQQQVAAVQETSTTMDELKASSLQSSEHADISAAAAKQVMTLANAGTQVVNHTLSDMEVVCQKVEAIAVQIRLLNEQAQQIAGITDIVSDLANQTNMLSLNAAVEAVRAGENGRGFSVVAGEIRKLADQSRGSAAQIKDLIKRIQVTVTGAVETAADGRLTVEQGAKMVQETATTFMRVVEAVDNVANSSEQISLNAKQQVDAIQQVVEAMTTLNHESIRYVAGISQTRSSAEQLNEAVVKLQAIV